MFSACAHLSAIIGGETKYKHNTEEENSVPLQIGTISWETTMSIPHSTPRVVLSVVRDLWKAKSAVCL